jgi:hypothetical protein
MAAVSTSRRSTAGIVLGIAGILLALAILIPQLGGPGLGWLTAISFLAIAAAFLILGFGAVNSNAAKITLIAAALGWLVLGLGAFGLALPNVIVILAVLLAGVVGLLAAVILYVGKEVRNVPAIVFIITMALGLLYLLPRLGVALAGLTLVIAILFAAGLIVSGVLFWQRERGRR